MSTWRRRLPSTGCRRGQLGRMVAGIGIPGTISTAVALRRRRRQHGSSWRGSLSYGDAFLHVVVIIRTPTGAAGVVRAARRGGYLRRLFALLGRGVVHAGAADIAIGVRRDRKSGERLRHATCCGGSIDTCSYKNICEDLRLHRYYVQGSKIRLTQSYESCANGNIHI